jgi:hypothetical protein
LKWAEVTPDGQALWFSTSENGGETGAAGGETGPSGGETEATRVYVVPTSTYTSNPTPATGNSALGPEASLIAWRQGEKLTNLRG